jgi:putative DNA primase/helicase
MNLQAKLDELDAGKTSAEWPDPQPLPSGLPAVAKFDFAFLPDTLKPWAKDIAERVQCAPDFVGVTIMAGLGSVIGRKLGIRPQAHTDWAVTPNQWALVIGRPGVLKSPAMEAALSPLKRLAAQATELHHMEMQDYKRKLKLAKLKAEEGEKAARKVFAKDANADLSGFLVDEEPEARALRRYIANDTTAAALGELHRQNHNGLLLFRDELVSLLKSLDREDNAEARGFYLTGWNGHSPYTFDRITRGMNLHIPAVCLSLLGSTQPGRIADYIRQAVRGGSGDDGLIQRFGLLVWPDIGGDWHDVDRWPDGDAKREANRVFDYLDKLEPASIGARQETDHQGKSDGLPYLRFDTGGLELFLEWRTLLEARLRDGELHPAMESHLAKYRKLVPGLALILHLASGSSGPVSKRATLQALAWAEYLETHAHRAYASVTTPEASAAKAIIQRLCKGDLPAKFSSRDVWRPGWAMLSDRELVADALQLLADLDWLHITKQETAGRTATIYEVNPKGLAV